ncbi:MAG: tail fiber domain-containing protein, partial [Dolichospermum sp.]
EVKIQNTQELSESSDVLITTPTNGQILQYNGTTSLWNNVAGTTSSIAEGSNLYYTDARARGAISLTTTGNNGASTYNSTTGVLNVPTYTLAGLGGINLTSLSATSPLLYDNTTGVFSIQQSSGSQAGFLSAADWTTFNSKQGAITLTTTGSSGAATFSAGTLNIPNYTLSGLGGVPTTRTLSINGTTYDLSADRSWTITPNVNATNTQDYTATAAQTTFTVTGGYTVGQLAVFYNGSKLASNEFTATNGTTFVLATACQANDIVQAVVSVTGGGIGGSGTTNYISKWSASGVLTNSIIFDNGTNVGIGTASPANKLSISNNGNAAVAFRINDTNANASFLSLNASNTDAAIIAGGTSAIPFDIYTGGVARFRVSSTGNVGIGTDSPTNYSGFTTLHINGKSGTSGGLIRLTSFDNSSGINMYIAANAMIFNTTAAIPYSFQTQDTERMRITGGGNVLINTTTSNNTPLEIECGSGGDGIYLKRSGAYSQMFIGGNTTGTAITFIRTAGSGGVRLDSGATAWASSSDERLKNINGSIENALDSLLTLRAVNFSWKSDETNKNNLGLIAQDIVKVFPETVTLDEENDVLGVRYTELIPVLVKAIQELKAEVDTLKQLVK